MNTTEFSEILQNPDALTEDQTQEIKSVIDEFPYFQSARALYLKGLKDSSSFKYNQELKTTAAYTTDRSILFDYITSEEFLQNKISEKIKHNLENLKNIEVKDIEDITVNKSVTIDEKLQEQIRETKQVTDPALFQPAIEVSQIAEFEDQTEENEIIEVDPEKIENLPEEKLELGKPLEFDKNETHSFNEWLKLTSFKPISRDEEEKDLSSKDEVEFKVGKSKSISKSKKFQLIDKFITKKPKIETSKHQESKKNIAKERMIKPESLMTETLARIYLEQKNYKKAIQAYKILSLKYPEKSGFFADQIKAVKQLQEKNNKE